MEAIRTNAAFLRREIQVYLHYSLEKLFPLCLLRKTLEINPDYEDYPKASKGFFVRVSDTVHSIESKARSLNQKYINST